MFGSSIGSDLHRLINGGGTEKIGKTFSGDDDGFGGIFGSWCQNKRIQLYLPHTSKSEWRSGLEISTFKISSYEW